MAPSACRAALIILLSMASILVCSDDILAPVGLPIELDIVGKYIVQIV